MTQAMAILALLKYRACICRAVHSLHTQRKHTKIVVSIHFVESFGFIFPNARQQYHLFTCDFYEH